MNWEHERYVRLYTRDTVTWKLIGWQARCLLPLLLRKVDRVGCLNLDGAGADGIAALVDIPLEVAEPGFNALLARGVVEVRDGVLIFPHFLEAQEAKHSDKARQAESRGRKRDALLRNVKVSEDETERDEESHGVTNNHAPGQNVTCGHAASHGVTPSCTVPSCTVLDPPIAPPSGGAPQKSSHPTEAQTGEPAQPQAQGLPGVPDKPSEPAKAPKTNRKRDRDKAAWDRATLTATTLLAELSQAIIRVRPGARPLRPTPSNLEQITARLLEDNTVDDIRHVIKVCEARAKHDQKALSYFDAVTPFRKQNLGMWLAKTVEDAASPARDGPRPSWKADPTIGTDRGLPSEEDYKRWNG